MNKGKLFLICSFICILTIISININNSILPYDFLAKEMKNAEAHNKPSEILYHVDMDEGEYLVFYINEKRNLTCAIIKKRIFSHSLLRICSELLITGSERPTNYMLSSYNKGRAWIDWGIIRDNTITKVLVNGENATIVEAKGLRFFYITHKGNTPSSESVYQFFDTLGQPIFE